MHLRLVQNKIGFYKIMYRIHTNLINLINFMYIPNVYIYIYIVSKLFINTVKLRNCKNEMFNKM